ncbi:MAG: GyrI-like domain-containing protein [Gemmatimonadetes bacterium]|nr:GyrI-like domain-containing protein [Gemmatimonadota bacterium]
MTKIDLRSEFKTLFRASRKNPVLLEVPELQYLTLHGRGDPNGADFQLSVNALYSLAYTLRFRLKKRGELEYSVMPLEGLWWMPGHATFDPQRSDDWHWTLMILQPSEISGQQVADALAEACAKKPELETILRAVRLESFREGRCAQMLHVGSYATEGSTIEKLHHFIRAAGGRPTGNHHEIYLSDPRRSTPEKLKTILRQPYE